MSTNVNLEVTLFVHAHFNAAGQFDGYHVNANWRYDETVREHGVYVLIHQEKVIMNFPEAESEMRGKAAETVEGTIKDLTAKHVARITALKGLQNRLLCLAAPDILDAGTSDRLDVLRDDDSDIPF